MGDVLSPPSRSGYALRLGAMIRLTSCGGHKRRVSAIMCLLFLVRPTRGRSMGDVLFPQSFGLRPPTGGYEASDRKRSPALRKDAWDG